MKNLRASQGCEVFVTAKGEEAWEIFKREKPQAVSIDLHLIWSAFDGLTLLEKIRQVDTKVFCAVFTRIVEKDVLDNVKAAGADAIFLKPPVSEELRELIDCLAGKSQGGV